MAEKFKMSAASTEASKKLQAVLRIKERPIMLRLALAKGLLDAPVPIPESEDSGGSEIYVDTIVQKDEKLYDALIRQKIGTVIDEKDKRRLYKNLVDFGFSSLTRELGEHGENVGYLSALALRHRVDSKKASAGATSYNGTIVIGPDRGEQMKLLWNNHEHNQHLAVIGTTGAGKTQFVLDLLAQIFGQAADDLGLIFLDYAKGDVGGNPEFVRATGTQVIDLMERPAPVNPFYEEEPRQEQERNYYIEAFIDIVDSVEHIGPKQRTMLYEAVKDAYQRAKPYPDFYVLRRVLEDRYEEAGQAPDTVSELLRKLTEFRLFPRNQLDEVYGSLYQRRVIFDLHRLSAMRELVAFLILYKLYDELAKLPDSEVDPVTGTRQMRCVVVIDEAHEYLKYKNETLEKMLRVLRSKGVAVMLLSQSINDFDQKHFDYSELLNWVFVMKSNSSSKALQRQLAISSDKAQSWATRIANLAGGEVVTRRLIAGQDDVITFPGKRFWERKS